MRRNQITTYFLKTTNSITTVPAQILRQSWLERHVSILFSKICQFLTFYLVKSSPKNPRRKLERRRSICAGTVGIRSSYPVHPHKPYMYVSFAFELWSGFEIKNNANIVCCTMYSFYKRFSELSDKHQITGSYISSMLFLFENILKTYF